MCRWDPRDFRRSGPARPLGINGAGRTVSAGARTGSDPEGESRADRRGRGLSDGRCYWAPCIATGSARPGGSTLHYDCCCVGSIVVNVAALSSSSA